MSASETRKYRKKPIEIEAIQFDGSPASEHEIINWAGGWDGGLIQVGMKENTPVSVLLINTLEGVMQADRGDWIIKGVKGELYPCKPEIFAATYEVVE